MRRVGIVLLVCLCSFPLVSQSLDVVVSGGVATHYISQDFTQAGQPTTFTYFAPGVYLDAEMDWGGFFMDIPLSFLFAPFSASLGGQTLNLSSYGVNNAVDFSLNLGYLFPLNPGLSVGGAVGLHVSGPWLEAPNDNPSMFNLIDYGLIGVNLLARVRYTLMKSLYLTLTVPVGIDLTYMNPDIVVGGVDTGVSVPATIYPSSLRPQNTGMTYGATLSVGYAFPIAD